MAAPSLPNRRVATPTILQMEAVECGAAALGIILAHHGRWESLATLREACGVSRDGSKASNMVKAARTYGLEAKGYRKSLATVLEMPLPAIVHWEFNHFLVLEGHRRGTVYLNDPATGPRAVSVAEFDAGFTGIALALTPGPDFRPAGRGPSLRGAVLPLLGGMGGGILFVLLASLALLAPGLAAPAFARVFVDEVLIHGHHDWLPALVGGMLLTLALWVALETLRRGVLLRMRARLAARSTAHFFDHLLRLPIQFFAQRDGGEIGDRIRLNEEVAALLFGNAAVALIGSVLGVVYLAVMAGYDVTLTLMVLWLAALHLALLLWIHRWNRHGDQRLQRDRGRLAGLSIGGIQMIETLKAGAAAEDFFARWAGRHAQVREAEQRAARGGALLDASGPLFTGLAAAAILSGGALQVMQGRLTVGELCAFALLGLALLRPLLQLGAAGVALHSIRGHVARLEDVLEHPSDPERPDHLAPGFGPTRPTATPSATASESTRRPPAAAIDGARHQPRLRGDLRATGLDFGFGPLAPPILRGVDLHAAPGKRIAIVGPSGSGKSTLARVLAGLHRPVAGEILLDGQPRRRLRPGLVARSVAYVDQEIVLFEGTIRDNLTLWDRTLPEDRILAAAKDACIHQDIVARPGGYDAPVVAGGLNFSGGQRQRLELARALVGTPSILLLDEATSALDPETERRVDDGLRRRGCTCLIVAHRLSTIRDADEIIVLEAGAVAQRGRHATLMADRGGLYARLVREGAEP